MKDNITLIGMPAAGKSTIGVLLAKRIGYSFVDVDILIQEQEKKLLKDIIAERGLEGFLKLEEEVNAGLKVTNAVIAPGGSVVYGKEAMEHLKQISEVVYLKLSYEEMARRVGDVVDRGVALKPGYTLKDLYTERAPLYEHYADITVDEMEDRWLGDTVDRLRIMIEKEWEQQENEEEQLLEFLHMEGEGRR